MPNSFLPPTLIVKSAKIMRWTSISLGSGITIMYRVPQPTTHIEHVAWMQGKLRAFAPLSHRPHLLYKTSNRDQCYNSNFSLSIFRLLSTTRKIPVITLLQLFNLKIQWGLSLLSKFRQFLLSFLQLFQALITLL